MSAARSCSNRGSDLMPMANEPTPPNLRRIEAAHRTGAKRADEWGCEPNLRAEIKRGLAEQIAIRLQLANLIQFVVTTADNGDTIITASLLAARTGDDS